MARSSESEERWPVVAVVDGQGGGIGGAIIRGLREQVGENVDILPLGTNAAATTTMMRAGANRGATGENAIARSVEEADLIAGNAVIVMAHAMMGELTPRMAEAIAGAHAEKWLLPLAIPGVELMGVDKKPLPHLIKLLGEMLVSRRSEFSSRRRMRPGGSCPFPRTPNHTTENRGDDPPRPGRNADAKGRRSEHSCRLPS